MPSERPLQRLRDIVDNAERASAYVDGMDFAAFRTDHLKRDAVERCIERISEAARKLDERAEAWMPEFPWPEIRAIGNILRHLYDDVDPAVIWRIVTEDLPRLSEAARRVLNELGADKET